MRWTAAWAALALACAHGNPPPRVAETRSAVVSVALAGETAPRADPESLREAALRLQRDLAPAAEACYDRALRAAEARAEASGKPQDAAKAQGVAVVAFAVGPGGEISDARVAESELALEGLDECLVGLFARRRLDAHGPEEIEMPFRFTLKAPR